MKHIKVKWIHPNPTYPILLFTELDCEMWEVRKVEVYADGRRDFADFVERSGTTKLGLEPYPPLEEIAADPQFTPIPISAEEFEIEWQQAKGNAI